MIKHSEIYDEVHMKNRMIIGLIIAIFFLSGCGTPLNAESYITTNISEYRNFKDHIEKEESDLFSGLRIFPLEITEKMQEVSYIYECGNSALDNNYFIYLNCSWQGDSFEKEIERLENISVSNNSITKTIVYDINIFSYPAYVSVYDEEVGIMEYALINQENKEIVYIYSQLNSRSELEDKIEQDYLPFASKESKNETFKDGYNMYLFEINENLSEYIK